MEGGRRSGGPPSDATIADVARRAGVSPMTVSRVVNKAANVRSGTREAVAEAIRELGYAPNLAARNLARAHTIKLGAVHSNPSSGFLGEFLVGLLDAAGGEGAPLGLVQCGDGEAAERSAVAQLLEGGARAVVLPPPHSESAVIRTALAQAGVAVGVVAAGRPAPGAVCLRIDDRRAAREMMLRLMGWGHRRIGVIGGPPDQTSSDERLIGVRAAAQGAADVRLTIADGRFDYLSGLRGAEALLAMEAPPTAIFAFNDDMAAAAISLAHRRGLDVPRDLTVVGFDDTALAVTLWPPLTTVRQPVRAMASRAAALLIAHLRSAAPALAGHDEILPFTLVERGSTAPARTGR